MIPTNSFGSYGGRAEEDDGRNWIEIVFLRLGHLKSHYNNEFNQAPRLHLISPHLNLALIALLRFPESSSYMRL